MQHVQNKNCTKIFDKNANYKILKPTIKKAKSRNFEKPKENIYNE